MKNFFSTCVENAVRLANFWHSGQLRKGEELDCFTHLASVGLILTRAGFDEEVIAAGVCHDVLEDTDCPEEELANACGERVLYFVQVVTEDKSIDEERNWELRKEKYIRTIKAGPWEAKAVSVADKIHNLQTLMAALEEYGLPYFKFFHRGPEKKLWFEDQLCMMVQNSWQHPLVNEYDQLIDHFVQLLEDLDKEEKKGIKRNNIPTSLSRVPIITPQAQVGTDETDLSQVTIGTQGSSSIYLNQDEYKLLVPAALQICLKIGSITNKDLQETLQVNYLTAYRLLKEFKRLHVIDRADSFQPRHVDTAKVKEVLKDLKRKN